MVAAAVMVTSVMVSGIDEGKKKKGSGRRRLTFLARSERGRDQFLQQTRTCLDSQISWRLPRTFERVYQISVRRRSGGVVTVLSEYERTPSAVVSTPRNILAGNRRMREKRKLRRET